MLKRKILIVSLIYTVWLGILLFSESQCELDGSPIGEVLLRPYMTAILYPLVFNSLVFLIYKNKPMETECDKAILIWIIVIASVCLVLRGIAKYMYAGSTYFGGTV